MFRASLFVLAALSLVGCKEKQQAPDSGPQPTGVQRLTALGPRIIANDTSYPIYLYGENLQDGMELEVRKMRSKVHRISSTLATTEVQGVILPAGETVTELTAVLVRGEEKFGTAPLKVVNNTAFPIPYDIEVVGEHVFGVSPTTDTVWKYQPDGPPARIAVGDRPRVLKKWGESLLVLHEYAPELWVIDPSQIDVKPRVIPAPRLAQDIAIEGDRAYITSVFTDRVHILDLVTGKELNAFDTGVNPRAVAVGGGKIAVSNLGSDNLVVLEQKTGALTEVVVGPDAKIVGGHTEAFAPYVMGLKAPRDLHYSPKHDVFLASTIGPNTGPNPKRMAVSMNSGVSVIGTDGVFRHHVSMRRGTAQQIAMDEERDVILAADVGTGRVVAFDMTAVIEGREAVRGQFFAQIPKGTKFLRPENHYGTDGRNTASMYAGPWAIRIENRIAYVLNRFFGTVTELDYTSALHGKFMEVRTLPAPPLGAQTVRRAGEVVFHTDLGDTRQTCDGCHLDGHNQGTLFTKSAPMHIYRVTSLRSISETPPYFTPAMFPSLATIGHVVGGRIRDENLPPNTQEVAALGMFQRSLAPPPNPFFNGPVLPKSIELPDGETGNPISGSELFDVNCASCHPAPMFTPDQDPKTRGKTFEMGEVTIALRPEMQDAKPYPVPVPTLVGVWDNHPLFHGGQAGNVVKDGRLVATRFALREVLARKSHFDTSKLDGQAHNDLLAYLLTL